MHDASKQAVMKIHFIASTLAGGGAERVLVLLANELVVRGHSVSIITMNDGQSYELHPDIDRIKLHGGFRFNHTIRNFSNLFGHYRLKQNRPDIAIAFMPRMGLITIVVCKLFGIRNITSEHNNHIRKVPAWTTLTRKYIYRHADAITVLTEFDRKFYESRKAKVVLMPNPCTFDILNKPATRQKVILAVGGLDRIYHKGFDNLLHLIAPVLQKHPEWHLMIAGGGNTGFEILTDIAKENNILDRVTFLGFVNNVNEIMRTCEIFILPSRFEGLPMVLLEAMSQGMACIAYDCITGPSDIIDNEVTGLLIKDQDKAEMAAGLNRLIENEKLRRELQSRAPKSLDKFSMDAIMNRWHSLFKEVRGE